MVAECLACQGDGQAIIPPRLRTHSNLAGRVPAIREDRIQLHTVCYDIRHELSAADAGLAVHKIGDMSVDSQSLNLGVIAMGLLGGLSIFLYGLEVLTNTLKEVAGDRMKLLLAKLTTNRFKGVFAGAFTTAVIQSSSVTTVLSVGFVAAGLIVPSLSITVSKNRSFSG